MGQGSNQNREPPQHPNRSNRRVLRAALQKNAALPMKNEWSQTQADVNVSSACIAEDIVMGRRLHRWRA